MVSDENVVPEELKRFFPIAKGIAKNFGKNCEVVIHDLRMPDRSVIYMEGNVTNRTIGSPVTNLALELLHQKGDSTEDQYCYKTITKDGRILKSTTMFIRNNEGKIIGCMCINYDMTELLMIRNMANSLVDFSEEQEHIDDKEWFAKDVNEALEKICQNVIENKEIPPSLMQKEEKKDVVKELDAKGVFLIKGAVDYIANLLGVSRYTVYNYLDEIRSKGSTYNVK